jgi:hypothetical protein
MQPGRVLKDGDLSRCPQYSLDHRQHIQCQPLCTIDNQQMQIEAGITHFLRMGRSTFHCRPDFMVTFTQLVDVNQHSLLGALRSRIPGVRATGPSLISRSKGRAAASHTNHCNCLRRIQPGSQRAAALPPSSLSAYQGGGREFRLPPIRNRSMVTTFAAKDSCTCPRHNGPQEPGTSDHRTRGAPSRASSSMA